MTDLEQYVYGELHRLNRRNGFQTTRDLMPTVYDMNAVSSLRLERAMYRQLQVTLARLRDEVGVIDSIRKTYWGQVTVYWYLRST